MLTCIGSAAFAAWVAGLGSGPATCNVRVRGLPHSQQRHHSLVVGDQIYRLDAVVEVPREGGAAILRGPRYAGRVDFETACEEADLWVQPLPARLSFACLPAGTVVSCEDCPGWRPGRPYLPGDVPLVQVASWERDVTLVLKARGYESLRLEVTLHPGPNHFQPELTAR